MIIKDAKKPDTINEQRIYKDRQNEGPFLRTPYNYDKDKASNDTGLHCKDPSLAQQQFKDESDINVLFARYLDTGLMPQVEDTLAYGDFTGVFDYQTAMNAVKTAEGMFSQLPAKIKNRFDNDPQKLLEFLGNEENYEEAQFLGLVKKPEAGVPAAATLETGQPGGTKPAPQAAAATSDTGGGNPAASQ